MIDRGSLQACRLRASHAGAADAKTGKVVETLRTTRDHPFYVEGKGWVAARYLGIGTSIVTRAGPGHELRVKSNRRVAHRKGIAVYNFEVQQEKEDGEGQEGDRDRLEGRTHSYFVGNSSGGAWVHNTDCHIQLKYKNGWSSAQRAEADAKVGILNEMAERAQLRIVKNPVRSASSASRRYRRSTGETTRPTGKDADHIQDLQLGGPDTTDNMWWLDSSVNQSLGPQIQHQIAPHGHGTLVHSVTIR